MQMGAAKVRGTLSTRRGTVSTHGGLCAVPMQMGAAKVMVGCGSCEQMRARITQQARGKQTADATCALRAPTCDGVP